ncbi:hypothetical protein PENTCL1PPCAC_195 [Pristionchus entomophagus]|uniref:Regulatory protein zeste n=1 Tax=Pristionchus entomophagus TaxID=358040 RepID=A0AAV5S6Q4_9BILA|nr:hypothetical protein PENTCL1PPCAC_195 [Pristionchus entomophagus]
MSILTTRDLLLLSQQQSSSTSDVKTASIRSPPRHTSNHMSNAQCEQLVDLCREYYEVISDTGNSIESRTQRRRIWEFIAKDLNEKGHTNFTPAQYKKKYQNLKTSLKAKMNAIKRANANPMNNNNPGEAKKKISEASTSSPTTSAFGSPPHAFSTPLPSQFSFPSSFLNPPVSQLPSSTPLMQPTSVSLTAALAAAAGPSGTGTPLYHPIPQMGIPLNLQTLMRECVVANEQVAAAAAAANAAAVASGLSPIPPPPGTSETVVSPAHVQSPKSERSSTVISSPGVELNETLSLADADPVDVFCMSLAESVGRIRAVDPLLYTQLKRNISVLVLETEIKLLSEKEEALLQ